MSTSAVSSASLYQELQSYFQQRGSDLTQLGKSLQNGDLQGAQQEFDAIQSLAQSGPFAKGDALAFPALESTVHHHAQSAQTQNAQASPAVVVTLSVAPDASTASASNANTVTTAASSTDHSTPAAAGPEIVLNIGHLTAGEQITIGVNSDSKGGEQVTIGVSDQNAKSTEQIVLNLAQNSNQEIILNLFNSSTTSQTAQSSGVNATA